MNSSNKPLISSSSSHHVATISTLFVQMSSTPSASQSYDDVVVGAGIIRLSIARQVLSGSDLFVVIYAAAPCSGANGAGALDLR
ncbi:hypothetical protein L1987_12731 [Smallanthus sonchifolius]|uniref:Uncharacterized protein n=1 Tax=Smallanthus sonchifolius TaxID=185202 RepID=A0ACB9JF44_9ASTR|nr:hypothetical protein L1987_12731 [Smallanthus sonchifolius]